MSWQHKQLHIGQCYVCPTRLAIMTTITQDIQFFGGGLLGMSVPVKISKLSSVYVQFLHCI